MTDIEGPSYEERAIKIRTVNGELAEAVTSLVKENARQSGLWTDSAYVGRFSLYDAAALFPSQSCHCLSAFNPSVAFGPKK